MIKKSLVIGIVVLFIGMCIIPSTATNIRRTLKTDVVSEGNTLYVKFDIILCRNVIIYFNYNLQSKVFDLFHRNLYDSGCLLLGMHETILGSYSVKFQKKGHAYYKS